jgi:RNA polymerase sigma-70 factor, ECF subfamily
MSDAELVGQALAGERRACEQLVRRWSPRVLAVCHARVGRADAAEDLAQETLLRGLRSLNTLADPSKFGPWISGIAVRACLDWLKSRRRGEFSLSALEGSEELISSRNEEASEEADRRESIEELMDQVQRLPLPYRQVLLLYYYDDCTYQELAEMLGVSAATINARLTKARQMLREKLIV